MNSELERLLPRIAEQDSASRLRPATRFTADFPALVHTGMSFTHSPTHTRQASSARQASVQTVRAGAQSKHASIQSACFAWSTHPKPFGQRFQL